MTEKQKGVLKGVVAGALISLTTVIIGVLLNPLSFNGTLTEVERIVVALKSTLFPTFFLVISIGRLAKHRFFTPEDIDGGGLSAGTKEAKILQSLLQNTLEQLTLAIVGYLAWAVMMPVSWLSVVPLSAVLFSFGRVLFFVGYKGGAPSRALGFALSFYPTIIMLFCSFGALVWRQIS